MGYKMKGAPMIANTKSHGTNKNFQMSGPPFLGKLFGGAKKAAGNFMKGKGAFGLLNPMGAIASRMGAFGRKPAQPDPNAAAAAAGAAGQTVDPTAQPPVDPNMAQADPNMMEDPNAQVA